MRKSDVLEFDGGGRFSTANSWIHAERVTQSYELILVTKGTAHLFEGDRRYSLKPNDYIILHPGVPHGGFAHSDGAVEFYWLHFFNPPASFSYLEQPCSGHLDESGSLIQIIRQILHISNPPAYPAKTADHLLYVLLAELTVLREQNEPQNALAARVHEYIRSHSYLPLTAAEVAEALQYHPDHLSRVLKNCYGFTLQQDIANERLNRAKYLLQTTDLTVSQIAMELGYEEPNLFEKFFRYHTDTTPTSYRNSFAGMHTNHI